MKKFLIVIVLIVTLGACFVLTSCKKEDYSYIELSITARFLTNYSGTVLKLSSGRQVIAENELFKAVDLQSGTKLAKPEETPKRSGYKFVQWTTDKAGYETYDFDHAVEHSLNLYAQWERDEGMNIGEDAYTEPVLSFVEDRSLSAPNSFEWTQVCGAFIEDDDTVKLTTAGIKRLADFMKEKGSVKELLGYKVSASTTIDSAVFDAEASTVTMSYTSGVTTFKTVNIIDVTSSHKLEVQYETKAKKYEKNYSIDSYKVVLGGSSSMENWSTSTEDMDPVTTINVGIGGTTADQWANHLAARLIIPYNPRAVVLYVGINDIINAGKGADDTISDLKSLFNVIHTALPNTVIHYILINHVPGYYSASRPASMRDFGYTEAIDATNDAITAYASGLDYLEIIDAGTCLELDDGAEKSSYFGGYFRNDGLHMSVAGYELWGAEVKQAVINDDKERYSK